MDRIIVGESGWSDIDLKDDPDKLIKISEQIKNIIEGYSKGKSPTTEEMDILINNISDALLKWTGSTYVGVRKDIRLESAFNAFFDELLQLMYCFLLVNDICHDISQRILYQGVLYRYLGHCSGSENIYSRIKPEYNDTWVSWSKNDVRKNHYLGSKLLGTRTVLICETGSLNGIDLTGWDEMFGTNIVRANEEEVVFPTLKGTISDVIYLDVKKEGYENE